MYIFLHVLYFNATYDIDITTYHIDWCCKY